MIPALAISDGRFDFNQKRTTLNVDLSYTNSYTHATLDHDDYTLSMTFCLAIAIR